MQQCWKTSSELRNENTTNVNQSPVTAGIGRMSTALWLKRKSTIFKIAAAADLIRFCIINSVLKSCNTSKLWGDNSWFAATMAVVGKLTHLELFPSSLCFYSEWVGCVAKWFLFYLRSDTTRSLRRVFCFGKVIVVLVPDFLSDSISSVQLDTTLLKIV